MATSAGNKRRKPNRPRRIPYPTPKRNPKPVIYLIGSLRNPEIPAIGNRLRDEGFDVFDDWFAAGPNADDSWQEYSNRRGLSYSEALAGYAARHVFHFDMCHLERADAGVLVMPAGKSGHLELGFICGRLKPGFVLFDKEPERYDVMYQFASGVHFDIESLVKALKETFR